MRIEKPLEICSYHGCVEKKVEPTMAGEMSFCSVHDKEFTDSLPDARLILKFWVKAQGGAARAAKLAVGNLSHRALLDDEKVYW